MENLQTALDTLANNGSFREAIMYGVTAFILCVIISAILRNVFFIMLGVVISFYVFSLQTPDANIDLQEIAPEKIVSMMIDKSNCAAKSIGEIQNIGRIVRNGDVLDIAKSCGLMP